MKPALFAAAVMMTGVLYAKPEMPGVLRGARVLRVEPTGVQVKTDNGIAFVSSLQMTPEERKAFQVMEPDRVKEYEKSREERKDIDAKQEAAATRMRQSAIAEQKQNLLAYKEWLNTEEGRKYIADENRRMAEEEEVRQKAAAERAQAYAIQAAAEAQARAAAVQEAIARRKAYMDRLEQLYRLQLLERSVSAQETIANEISQIRWEIQSIQLGN